MKWLMQDLPWGCLQGLELQIPAQGLPGAIAEKTLTSGAFQKIPIGCEASSQLSDSWVCLLGSALENEISFLPPIPFQ